jgi:uncharacterized membrane protein
MFSERQTVNIVHSIIVQLDLLIVLKVLMDARKVLILNVVHQIVIVERVYAALLVGITAKSEN